MAGNGQEVWQVVVKESESRAHCKDITLQWVRSSLQILLSQCVTIFSLHSSVISFLPFVSCKTIFFITSTHFYINGNSPNLFAFNPLFPKRLKLLKPNSYYLNQLLPFSLKPVYTSGTQMCTLRTKSCGCPKLRVGYLGHRSVQPQKKCLWNFPHCHIK